MDGGPAIQVRPIAAYVLLAALAGVMMTGTFDAEAEHVVVAGPPPAKVAAPTSEPIILATRLVPAQEAPTLVAPPPAVSPSGEPVLSVQPIVPSGSGGSGSGGPGAGGSGMTGSGTPSASSPTPTQLQPDKPGKGKGKAKGQTRGGHGKVVVKRHGKRR